MLNNLWETFFPCAWPHTSSHISAHTHTKGKQSWLFGIHQKMAQAHFFIAQKYLEYKLDFITYRNKIAAVFAGIISNFVGVEAHLEFCFFSACSSIKNWCSFGVCVIANWTLVSYKCWPKRWNSLHVIFPCKLMIASNAFDGVK